MKKFINDCKKIYKESSHSTFAKKRGYENKIRAILILVLTPIFLIFAKIFENILGVSDYITAPIGGILAIVISSLYASKKANDKFKG